MQCADIGRPQIDIGFWIQQIVIIRAAAFAFKAVGITTGGIRLELHQTDRIGRADSFRVKARLYLNNGGDQFFIDIILVGRVFDFIVIGMRIVAGALVLTGTARQHQQH
ncbi:hypothetical protein D3C78_1505340 [compost metagenome]